MRARLSVMLVTTLVMVTTSLLTPVAFAQEQNQQRDPNEGEPKHEINELQNRLHHTEDESKHNHIEGRIDALEDQRSKSLGLGSSSFGLDSLNCPGFVRGSIIGFGGFSCGSGLGFGSPGLVPY